MANTKRTGGPNNKSKDRKKSGTKNTAISHASDKVEAKQAKAEVKTKASQPSTKRRPLNPRTYYPKQSEISGWRIVDATGLPLGRLSSYIAHILMGKDKAAYTRFADTGDHVVVINAKSVLLTGNKWEDKKYHHHTNYPGGLKTFTAKELLEKHPERLIQRAVYGMLPKFKGHMVHRWYKKLRVFSGADHPHAAQKPQVVKLPNIGIQERT